MPKLVLVKLTEFKSPINSNKSLLVLMKNDIEIPTLTLGVD